MVTSDKPVGTLERIALRNLIFGCKHWDLYNDLIYILQIKF